MKTTILSELPIVPEQYAAPAYGDIDWPSIHSEMSDVERRFISGLICYYEPQDVLEIGVCTGAGTVNILNAVEDRGDVRVVSIDRAENGRFGSEGGLAIGSDVNAALGFVPDNSRWMLIKGKDPSQVMGKLDEGSYEFVVIDTAHRHPVESMNFLCALPYIKDGAIVVLHDISLFLQRHLPSGDLATRILMCSLVGEKLFPNTETEPNICAIQVNAETRRHIRNVFDALMLPWGWLMSDGDLQNIGDFIGQHYAPELAQLFHRAVRANRHMALWGKTVVNHRTVEFINKASKSGNGMLTLYGAGTSTRRLLGAYQVDFPFGLRIWDMDAYKIGEIGGYKVSGPDFETRVVDGAVIIMIENESIAGNIRAKLEPLGYRVYHGISAFIAEGGKS